jgi:hypothetical protein
VLPDHPNYLLHAEANVQDVSVLNNVFRRGWSDQCAIDGDRALISGNDIRDGQDMGITANGGQATISNNVVRHQGAGGIASSGGGTLISNNILSRNSWVNFQDHVSLADIIVGSLPIPSDRPLVTGNQCDGEDKPLARYGIVLHNTSEPAVADNKCRRHTVASGGAGIHCYEDSAGGPSGMRIWNNDVSAETTPLKHTNVAEGGDYQLVGTDDPNTAASNFQSDGITPGATRHPRCRRLDVPANAGWAAILFRQGDPGKRVGRLGGKMS